MEQDESSIPGLVEVVGVKDLGQIQESVMFENEQSKRTVDKWALTMENFGTGLASCDKENTNRHKSIHAPDKGDRMN